MFSPFNIQQISIFFPQIKSFSFSFHE
jgi:hypothetical protein